MVYIQKITQNIAKETVIETRCCSSARMRGIISKIDPNIKKYWLCRTSINRKKVFLSVKLLIDNNMGDT